MTPPLELFALEWLRFHKRCVLVMTERSPREWYCGRPDVLGILPSRHMIEIEIKRTLADFRSNAMKDCMSRRVTMPDRFPRQYYFLVPYHLMNRVGFELPEWAGLMRGPTPECVQQVAIIKRAPINSFAKRLSLDECVRAVGHLTNENVSLRRKVWDQSEREIERIKVVQQPPATQPVILAGDWKE